MDLASMLNNNDRPASEKRSSTFPTESRGSTAQREENSLPPPRHTPGQQTPLYAPQSASQSQRGLTPLHTPSQAPGQYPFPQQAPAQSPASAHPYRSFEPLSATTPGPRPQSHGYSYAHPSPSMGQYHQPNALGTASLSPTPSSHHSQTSHSVRQSPLSTIGQPQPQQLGQPATLQHFHQSQPNTPLGPPQLPQRYSNSQLDVSSPHHSRTMSGASSGMAAGSPQQHGSTSNIVESPSMHTRPSPQTRGTSDYRSSLDRERSVSVSPKTMVPPRSSSHGSRHSSQQEYIQQEGGVMATNSTYVPHHTPSHGQPGGASEVSQAYTSSIAAPPVNGNPLSRSDNNKMQTHQPQKMGMSHLLAPTQHAQELSLPNGAANHTTPPGANGSRQGLSLPSAPHSAAPPQAQARQASSAANRSFSFSSTNASGGAMSDTADTSDMARAPPVQAPSKRPAEADISPPPAKRRRRHRDRPVWAQLAPQNPRASKSHSQQATTTKPMAQLPKKPSPAITNHPPPPPASGDTRWEKSFRNVEPLPSLNKAITDHLWMQLQNNDDIGRDAREGMIEIEAKIGTLVSTKTGDRCNLPVMSACALHPSHNHHYRFESEMNELEHRNMNQFLNQQVQLSHADRSRVQIKYEHIRETDHFQSLNDAGVRALPQTAQRRHADLQRSRDQKRDLKLRTSVSDSKDPKGRRVTGRIVKIKIGEDLHIFSPFDPYDIRISMNLEVNLLDRPDIDPASIVNADGPQLPHRKKDRLSYIHQAYRVDLTRVDTDNMLPKYELELELDANEARDQIELIKQNQPSRLEQLVDGFVNNMTFLMRVPRQQP